MTIKERIIEDLRNVNFGNDFLNKVGETWIDEMEENNDAEYILGEIKDVTEYGAATGGVNFVIYTADNEKFIGKNLSDMFEFINYAQNELGINLTNDTSADLIMYMAVEECARTIAYNVNLNISYYEEEEEEVTYLSGICFQDKQEIIKNAKLLNKR